MSTTVVGVGNILYRDEGVGVYAARCLEQCYRFDPEIQVVDGALLGFELTELFERESATVIVLDALLADAPPGTIYRLPTEQLLDLGPDITPTAHEVDPIHSLRRARAFGHDTEMLLLGIVPEDASTMSVGLTPVLEAAFPRFVAQAATELRSRDVRGERIRDLSVDQVIEGLVTRAV